MTRFPEANQDGVDSGDVLGVITAAVGGYFAVDAVLSRDLIAGGVALGLMLVALWFGRSLKGRPPGSYQQ